MKQVYLAEPKDTREVFSSVDQMQLHYRYIGVEDSKRRYMVIYLAGDTMGYYAIRHGAYHPVYAGDSFFVFDSRNELLEWMKGGAE